MLFLHKIYLKFSVYASYKKRADKHNKKEVNNINELECERERKMHGKKQSVKRPGEDLNLRPAD